MRIKFLIIPSLLVFQLSVAQTSTKTVTAKTQGTATTAPANNTSKTNTATPATTNSAVATSTNGAAKTSTASTSTSSNAAQTNTAGVTGNTSTAVSTGTDSQVTINSLASDQTAIMDYKSVYDAPTLEEEMQMATERYNLTKSQQDVWMTAATDRRAAEKQAKANMEGKINDYDKAPVYKGLKMAQTTFYETIIGYLNPAQKQAMETDREILEEKRKRIAKLPPPPPTVTVTPVDSTAIKAEMEKEKKAGKKSTKKKKKPAGA